MKTLRLHLSSFILLLVLSGITAFPLQTEIDFLFLHRHVFPNALVQWIGQLYNNIHDTPAVMLYGTDWLAFAHIIISLFFIPVWVDPIKYKVNLQIGMVACLLIFPLAFICGPVRGIPFFHQLIDSSFGFFGFLYLFYILKKINHINTQTV